MKKPDKILFETTMTAHGGREGRVTSEDNDFALALSLPKAMGGAGGDGTNPEQLFAAGYSACFLGAVKFVARGRKITLPDDISVSARVGIGPIEVGYALTVALTVKIPGIDKSTAEELVAGAHERCPYSNATRGNVDVSLTVF